MARSAPLLSVENLSIELPGVADRTHAVAGVSFSVAPGEILCIVGESGSGKSVMSLAIMGLLSRGLSVEGGKILFEGQDLLTMPPKARRDLAGRRIAMVFQEPIASLNPFYRVGEQVAEVFRLHTDMSKAEIRERVLELFSEVLLPEPELIYQRYPHQLSGGQCQRVMIAMALALEPAVLIADEPTTALDVTTQAQILDLIRDLRDRHGTAVVFITHDFGVVEEIADRVAVMQSGHLVEEGTKERIMNAPAHPYTRALLAAVPRLAPREVQANDKPPFLVAENLQKRWPERRIPALEDVSLSIRPGETIGLVGESGSGKSTLARAIIRLGTVDGGSIRLNGEDLVGKEGASLRALRRHIQMVFQDPYSALDPRQKIGSALTEGPMACGVPRREAEERVRDLISAVGLQPSALDRFPHEFSGGQRQRICIARALALRPDLLIADEALSALDVTMQAQVLELLGEMQARFGFAMLFITHDLRIASSLCDRICVMQRGRIIEEAEPRLLFAHSGHPYTQALLQAIPGADR
ncbi:ABC transporter ATP-binding protein [Nitratireductor pacificus]|uniref:ABC transporter nucleotide binding/ATPase protein (Peptide) n=1 Tax=Nitratireductor pacificus pht-3B TaxID=391937 RepID=K2LRW0_9HYPH|nr:ABC transporter ATP-binding protein [Nitratireductor pacificus]EKF20529.1 ABC transporter nucleotide binding/ATPase protein (Peptide) [Nitratireductor pacificus pht-3B]